MLRSACLFALLFWLIPIPAWALDPSRHISQFAHAAWRARDGFFNGTPAVVAQTPDGYLWIGTDAGLLRFDGVRFVPWSEGGPPFPSAWIIDLLTASDGSLWIATRFDLYRWKGGTLTKYPGVKGGIVSVIEGRHGIIWYGVLDPSVAGGSFCQALEPVPRCYSASDGVPAIRSVFAMTEDVRGDMWIGGDTGLLRWNKTLQAGFWPPGLKQNESQTGVSEIVAAPNGDLWVGFGKAGPGLGLQRLVNGRWASLTMPGFDSTTLTVTAMRRDGRGTLWVGTLDRGIYRIHDNTVEHFDSAKGLSGDYVLNFAEDREGSLWVATTQGLDRFSDTRVVSFSAAEGVCSTEVATVLASRDGGVWTGGDGALSRLNDGRVACIRAGKGLPGSQVTSLLEDHAGRLWVGLDTALWIYANDSFRKVSRADGSDLGMVTGIAEDSANNVWIAVGGSPRKLMRIEGFAVQEEFQDLASPRRVAADPTGGVWVGLLNGDLAHYAAGKLQNFSFGHDDAALVHQLIARSDGSVLAATSYGLTGWHNGKRLTLTRKNGLPCDGVNAMTFDGQGNLWLFMECALARVTGTDVQEWMRNPDTRVSVEALDVFDGVRTGEPPFAGGATSSDGRLWFANSTALLMVDPTQLRRNRAVPPVHIEQLIADAKTYPVTEAVRLPPLTRDLEIDYVGLSFVAPGKVQFRYRLDGRDEAWQEPGTRRQVFYSDLRPGRYRFRVIASNNEGIWNEQGAALEFIVAAAWYQTKAFWTACLLSAAIAMWALYQLRMRQMARALSARFDERLAERTRMARDIHDTLLQTVQGSKMVADHALARPEDVSGMRRAMEQVSTWLAQATAEGRAALNALRTSAMDTNDLAGALRPAIDECRRQGSIEGSLLVSGDARQMHPLVQDEICRIAYEAIRNACAHSGGTRVTVELSYRADLTVRVADDGVGMDSAMADQGKKGHFGLQGMRERAARIGAQLTVVSKPNAGTEVVLTVPGRIVFRKV
jgi:signal transduction histidine kinase/ligand-binding sensor domain-containing protein